MNILRDIYIYCVVYVCMVSSIYSTWCRLILSSTHTPGCLSWLVYRVLPHRRGAGAHEAPHNSPRGYPPELLSDRTTSMCRMPLGLNILRHLTLRTDSTKSAGVPFHMI